MTQNPKSISELSVSDINRESRQTGWHGEAVGETESFRCFLLSTAKSWQSGCGLRLDIVFPEGV